MKPSEIIREIIKLKLKHELDVGPMERRRQLTGTLMEQSILEFLDSIPMLEREKDV